MQYDFGAYDRAGRLKVAVEAKRRTRTSAEWASRFRRNLMAHGNTQPSELFAIVAPDKIYVWRGSAPHDARPDTEIDARPILAPYFERARVDPDHIDALAFELLIAWWLEDIARREEAAPDDPLNASGLRQALAGGRIAREVAA